nr:MAG: hypothetical protein [Marsupenaeus japonicus endogenous nimavirus]
MLSQTLQYEVPLQQSQNQQEQQDQIQNQLNQQQVQEQLQQIQEVDDLLLEECIEECLRQLSNPQQSTHIQSEQQSQSEQHPLIQQQPQYIEQSSVITSDDPLNEMYISLMNNLESNDYETCREENMQVSQSTMKRSSVERVDVIPLKRLKWRKKKNWSTNFSDDDQINDWGINGGDDDNDSMDKDGECSIHINSKNKEGECGNDINNDNNNNNKLSVKDSSENEGSAIENSENEGSAIENSENEGSAIENSENEGSAIDNSKNEGSAIDNSEGEGSDTDNSEDEGSDTDNSEDEGSGQDNSDKRDENNMNNGITSTFTIQYKSRNNDDFSPEDYMDHPIIKGWANSAEVEEAIELHKRRKDLAENTYKTDIFSACPIHLNNFHYDGCKCNPKILKNSVFVAKEDVEYWSKPKRRYEIFKYFGTNTVIADFIKTEASLVATVESLRSMLRELMTPFLYKILKRVDDIKIGKIDTEKIKKKIINSDKRNSWDTAYPSIDDIFYEKYPFINVYGLNDINQYISTVHIENISLIKCIIALLITPSNFIYVYNPSVRELDNIKNKKMVLSRDDNMVKGAIYCILFVIFRHMSFGTNVNPRKRMMKSSNKIPANPIYQVMMEYSLVDMSFSVNYGEIINSSFTLVYRQRGNNNHEDMSQLKSCISLCGKYGNLNIVPGNCSKLENYFLYKVKHIQMQISLQESDKRHVSNAESNAIEENAFFTRGYSGSSYICNAREDIIGVVPMHNFASLFNNTLRYFKIYNTDKSSNKNERVSCSEMLKMILKSAARTLTFNGYAWSFCPSFLRYEEKNVHEDEHIRYKIMRMLYGNSITNEIYHTNEKNLLNNSHKRKRNDRKRCDDNDYGD